MIVSCALLPASVIGSSVKGRLCGLMLAVSGRALGVLAAAFLVVAPAQGEPEPHQQIVSAVEALRHNDLVRLMSELMPPEEYAKAASEWEALGAESVTDEDRKKFEAGIGMLLAPDAEDAVMAMIEPQIAELRTQWDAQVPAFEGFLLLSVDASETMTAEDKDQAARIIKAVAGWARQNNLADPELARRAVSEAISTAKSLEVQTLDELKALSLEQVLTRGGHVLAGTKRIFEVYGISIDAILDSFSAETLSRTADTAIVKLGIELFGEPLETETEMELVGGRWISKQAQESLVAMAKPPGPATVKQTMPEVTRAPLDDIAEGPPIAASAAEVYLAYQDHLQRASAIDEITSYWMSGVAESALEQDEAQRQTKLQSLQQLAYDVQIVGERLEAGRVALDLVGVNDSGEPLDGRAVLARQEDEWRIDEITWVPRALTISLPDQAVPPMETRATMQVQEQAQEHADEPAQERAGQMPETEPVGSAVVERQSLTATRSALPAVDDIAARSAAAAAKAPPAVQADSGSNQLVTRDILQQAFDGNPFLKRYGVRIRAQEFVDGFLTAEITGGSETFLDSIRAGYDVIDGDLDELADNKDKQTAQAVRKTIAAMQQKYELLAVLLLAPPEPGGTDATVEAETPAGVASGRQEDEAAAPEARDSALPGAAQAGAVPQAEAAASPQADPAKPAAAETEAAKQARLAEEERRQAYRQTVRRIQARLADLGYQPGVADGIAGKGTRAAIEQYQLAAGLLVDGEASEALLAHLDSDAAQRNPQLEEAREADAAEAEAKPEEDGKLKKFFGNIFKKKKKEPDAE